MKQNQEIKARLDEWKKNLPDGSPLAKELADMERDAPLLTERFGAELSFGTAGLQLQQTRSKERVRRTAIQAQFGQ